jgi:hypothetical protein
MTKEEAKYLDFTIPIALTPLAIGERDGMIKKKIDCRKGHTYVNGKCRCGKDLGTVRF